MAVSSLMPISIVVCTFGAFFARRELWDLFTVVGIFFNEVLAQTLKHIVKEPRPASCAAVDFCTTYGMPSSHAQLSTFAATLATLHLTRRRRSARVGRGSGSSGEGRRGRVVDPLTATLVWSSWPVALATGISRVYLGYHSTEQVIVGSVVGVAFGAVWHEACCGWARAMAFTLTETEEEVEVGDIHNRRMITIVGMMCETVGVRDSSLVVDPVGVERKALLDAAADKMARSKKEEKKKAK